MNATGDDHTQWRQPERGQAAYDSSYMWNLKYATDEAIYETDSRMKKTDPWLQGEREGSGEAMDWEPGLADANYYV